MSPTSQSPRFRLPQAPRSWWLPREVHLLRLLLVLIITPAFGIACDRGAQPTDFRYRGPLLVVAVDGLDWDLMLPLLRRGKLPHLAALIEAGSIGALESTRSEFLPVTWTSLATGKSPDQHGIRGLIARRKSGRDERRLYTQADRKTKAFWNILSDYQRRSAIVGWWMTYPVEQVYGVMVAQTQSLDQARRSSNRASRKGGLIEGWENQVHPIQRSSELLAIHQRVARELPSRSREIFRTLPQPTTIETDRLWKSMLHAVESDLAYIEIMRHLASEDFDLMALYLGGGDIAGHDFLPYRYPLKFSPPPSEEQIANFRSVIADYYRFVDRAIGQISAQLPARRAILIVSLHGVNFKSPSKDLVDDQSVDPLGQRLDRNSPGVIIASGLGFRSPSEPIDMTHLRGSSIPRIGTVFDVAPTLLAYFDIPVGADMIGRPIASLLESPPAKTRFIPSHEEAAAISAE